MESTTVPTITTATTLRVMIIMMIKSSPIAATPADQQIVSGALSVSLNVAAVPPR